MGGYNAPKDLGYNVQNDYELINQNSQSSYNNLPQITSSLPIYNTQQKKLSRKSKCPRGALLGAIGSCCGFKCTRACAMEV